MCRLLGIVANRDLPILDCLTAAPRCLSTLSRQHPDGWGIALYSNEALAWRVHRSVARAYECSEFRSVAASAHASVVIAHVRQKTVGTTALANTHPFCRGPWVFAHNGTIKRITDLTKLASPERLAEIEGETDTERLFAFFLTRLDEAGLGSAPASDATTRVLARATRELRALEDFGAWNYLLSDGRVLYAHRFGRTLHMLRREDAVLIASEALTDEPWIPIEDGTFVRIERNERPEVDVLAA